MYSMGVFNGDMSSNSYLRDRVCVPRFDQPPLSPAAQLLNEALEPLDVTENETLPIPVGSMVIKCPLVHSDMWDAPVFPSHVWLYP